MNLPLRLAAAPILLLTLSGFTKRPDFIVRFFVEANEQDTERFAAPVQLKHPPRAAFIERVPVVSERNIKAIYPYPAPDGSWGCAFKLDPSGRIALETASTEQRGRSMVAYVGTKKGTHQVIDMIIDQRITDGVVTIQRGLTILEVDALQKRYTNLNPALAKKKGSKKAAPLPAAPGAPGLPSQSGPPL